MRMRKGRVFAHLGPVINPDICVIIADFFMRIDSVSWSIVSGFYNKTLIVVFRNDGVRKNAGKLAHKSFGPYGSAGGHKSMARAELPVENLKPPVDPQDEKKVLQWIIRQVEKRAGKK